jgi:hopanoid-associated phosphorylase
VTVQRRRDYVLAVSGLELEARIACGRGVRAVATGGDAGRAARLVESELARGAAAIISFGIAGGIDPRVAAGMWIIGRTVVTSTRHLSADAAWTQALAARLPGALMVDVAGSDAIVGTREAKRALQEHTGASIVDNESRVVAEIAATRGLPFAVFRVVSDPAGRALPAMAAIGLDAGGGIDVGAALRSLARAPAQWPSAARAAFDVGVALRALSDGRRRLGAGLAYPDFDDLLLDLT